MNDASDESVPVPGSATTGRLEFVGGADIVTIRAGASTGDLYRASFQGVAPDVQVEGGSVRVGYPRIFNPLDWRECSADFALNTAVPWELEVRGGLSRLDADLSGIRLRSLEIGGGSSDVDLTLPEPVGTVPLRIRGGTNNVNVRWPVGVAARVRLSGGAAGLRLDERRLGAVCDETGLESRDYAGATDRYEITITGGANKVSVLYG